MTKMICSFYLVLCSIGFIVGIDHDFKGFDDSILFGINWPGNSLESENLVETEVNKPQFQNKEILKITSSQKEKYECHIPELSTDETIKIEDYEGPSPLNLLKPLFFQKICSYRLESYWSYEVCHGRYIRQYHEEREEKSVNTQEYFLGHWNSEKHAKLESEMNAVLDSDDNPKTTKVEGMTLPFVEMAMDDGTLCDLNGKPRLTRVRYVCYVHGKHEVYSFKETSTCEYEIIILSPLLCEHPQFKPKDVSENIINCVPVSDSPVKPRNLLRIESENLKFNQQTVRLIQNDKDTKDVLAVLRVEKIDKDGETHLKLELHPLNDDDELSSQKPDKSSLLTDKSSLLTDKSSSLTDKSTPMITDDSPVRAFLNGETCLTGGTGWWKYEFCYGKHVIQYHVDLTGEKTTLLLGKFDEQAHLEWVKENKRNDPKSKHDQRTSASHFYSGGDMCDKTGKLRQTEVKLKCLENSSSAAQVSLYLLEPRTCHYILGVESPLICDILPLADANGLIKNIKPVLTKQDSVSESKDSNEGEFKNKNVAKIGND